MVNIIAVPNAYGLLPATSSYSLQTGNNVNQITQKEFCGETFGDINKITSNDEVHDIFAEEDVPRFVTDEEDKKEI